MAYIDRFLSLTDVKRSRLQLVGVTCMLVASKYEEIYAPQVGRGPATGGVLGRDCAAAAVRQACSIKSLAVAAQSN